MTDKRIRPDAAAMEAAKKCVTETESEFRVPQQLAGRAVVHKKDLVVDGVNVEILVVHTGAVGDEPRYSIYVRFFLDDTEVCRRDKRRQNMELAAAIDRCDGITDEDIIDIAC